MSARSSLARCDCPGGPATCAKPFCPYYHHTVELIGRRWTGDVLRALLRGIHRFGDLAATIPDISDRMLSERLKQLEAEGLVRRRVIPAMPVRVEYHLTPRGHALEPIMEAVLAWAGEWLAPERDNEHEHGVIGGNGGSQRRDRK